MGCFTKSIGQGAATTVFAAVSLNADVFNGMYLNNCCDGKCTLDPTKDQLNERLWNYSVQVTRVQR